MITNKDGNEVTTLAVTLAELGAPEGFGDPATEININVAASIASGMKPLEWFAERGLREWRPEEVAPLGHAEAIEDVDNGVPIWRVPPAGTVEEIMDVLRNEKKTQLYQRRVQAEKSPFQHEGRWYDGSDDSIERFGVVAQQITWALMAGVPMETPVIVGGWRDLNDVGGPSTIAELQAMLQSHYQHGVLCEQNSQALKTAINAATTMEELDAVDLEMGWPS